MALREISWFEPGAPVGDAVVEVIEQQLGVHLPPDFLECAKRYHGTGPEVECAFTYQDPDRGSVESCLGALLSFDLEEEYNILTIRSLLADQIPPGVIPFGEDGGGDFICFDFRASAAQPPVVYFAHEKPSGQRLIPLAADFASFLEMLYQPED